MSDVRAADSGSDISLIVVLDILARYGRRIVLSWVAITLVILALAGASIWFRPIERQSSVEFRLVFDGIDRDEYPNGEKFSRAEITSSSVLSRVYETNDLKRYLTYDQFEHALFVLESSKDLELLAMEYDGKLSDTRLTPVDRARLEEEYRQKRAGLKVAQYTLSLVLPGSVAKLPGPLANKVLNDVLAEWADQAATRKGAMRYQNVVYTPAVLDRPLGAASALERLDTLRGQVQRLSLSAKDMGKLPGANSLRFGTAKSLPDLRAALQDSLRYRVEPLIYVVLGSSTHRETDRVYLRGRLAQSQMDQKATEGQLTAVQQSFRQYVLDRSATVPGDRGGAQTGAPAGNGPAMMPQLSESFLDKLMQLSGPTQRADLVFRQDLITKMMVAANDNVLAQHEVAFYEELLRRNPEPGQADASKNLDQQIEEVHKAVADQATQLNTFFEELSKYGLNPQTNLYALTGPFVQRAISPQSTTSILASATILSFFALVLIVLAAGANYYLAQRHRRVPEPGAAQKVSVR